MMAVYQALSLCLPTAQVIILLPLLVLIVRYFFLKPLLITLGIAVHLAVYGYRVSLNTTTEQDGDKILQVAEGSIIGSNGGEDLLPNTVAVTTGSPPDAETSLASFNDGVNDTAYPDIYHSMEDTSNKYVQALGTNRLDSPSSGFYRVIILGRDNSGFRTRNNGMFISLLDRSGEVILSSSPISGFTGNDADRNGIYAEISVIGEITTDTAIFNATPN